MPQRFLSFFAILLALSSASSSEGSMWTVHLREHPLQTICLSGISVKVHPIGEEKNNWFYRVLDQHAMILAPVLLPRPTCLRRDAEKDPQHPHNKHLTLVCILTWSCAAPVLSTRCFNNSVDLALFRELKQLSTGWAQELAKVAVAVRNLNPGWYFATSD